MPKTTKPPPPQQTSLAEMWGKKKEKERPQAQKADMPKEEKDDMNVDEDEAEKRALVFLRRVARADSLNSREF